ncbi:Ubiquitin domain-containing protein DSK2b [Linum perenne]
MGIGGESSSAGDQSPMPAPAPEEDSGLEVVNIRGAKGIRFSVMTNLESSVEEFKLLVAQNCDIPANEMRLIYKGRILKDEQTLVSYGKFCVFFQFAIANVKKAGISCCFAVELEARISFVSCVEANQPVDMAHLLPRDTSANPMTNVPSSLHPDVEKVVNENPRLIKQLMNAPTIQALLDKPDLFRKVLLSNTLMQDIIYENPEIGEMMNDPVTFFQMLGTIRNPDLTREALRNIDLTKRKAETCPRKFSRLILRYQEVQHELLLNAIAMDYIESGKYDALQTRDDAPSYGPNTTPLPNPWTGEHQVMRYINQLQDSDVSGSSNEVLELQQSPQQATQESPQSSSSSDAQIFALPASASSIAVLPEEPYETELLQLREMGFLDTQENIRALIATDGDVDAAVKLLLKGKNKAL